MRAYFKTHAGDIGMIFDTSNDCDVEVEVGLGDCEVNSGSKTGTT